MPGEVNIQTFSLTAPPPQEYKMYGIKKEIVCPAIYTGKIQITIKTYNPISLRG